MNKGRRKQLRWIVSKLEELQAELQGIAEEERECFDNMTEGLRVTERGSAIEENADDMDYADNDFESLLDTLRN